MNDKERFIPLAKPSLGEKEVEAVRKPILSGWVTQGPEVAAFEREFAEIVGAQYACAVSSCTAALHLALLAVGVSPGDEVITVSYSYIATANSVLYCNAKPLFVDIQPDTFNMDPSRIEEVISKKTRAIICVHQLGMPCDLEAILQIAGRYSVPVIEDAACAIGSETDWHARWEKIGRPHGDIACFSFHPRKVITTGDGGMLTTANKEWDEKFRLWRQHGMSVPDTIRHMAKRVIFENYELLGYNYRMTDIQAAVGRVQLERLPQLVAERRQLAENYRGLLEEVPGVVTPLEPDFARSNWQSYCIRLPEGSDQRMVMQLMLDQGVSTRRGVMCAHREGAYARTDLWTCNPASDSCDCTPGACRRLVESELARDDSIVLPLYPQLTENEQSRVVAALQRALGG